MRPVYVIILAEVVLLITLLIVVVVPIPTTEQYNVTEIAEENYTVTEPRDIRIADWIKGNATVSEQFDDIRYDERNLQYDISLLKCSRTAPMREVELTLKEWGKIFTILYRGDAYFAGFKKGYFTKKDIKTFDRSSNEGNIYKIIKNERVNVTLKQGEYLPLDLGYRMQVNKIDDNMKSSKTACKGYGSGHYVSDDEDSSTGSCVTTTEYFAGASISLSDFNVVEKWDVKNNSTLIYQKIFSGGDTLPMIVVHINNVTNTTVNVDAIFQLSKDRVNVPAGLGAEIAVDVKNNDVQSGTFVVYTGFILNSTLGFEIGRLNQVFLNPSESTTLYYNTDKNKTEDCKYYLRGTSKVYIPQNFTNFRDVNYTKRQTQYRNVTQYVDVTKTRLVEKNVTKFRKKTIYEIVYSKISNG